MQQFKGWKVRRFKGFVLLLALLITGCGPKIVRGVVVAAPPRTEPEWHYEQGEMVMDHVARYWLVIDVDGEQRTIEVDPETWVKNYQDGKPVTLDCSAALCVAVEQDHE